MSMTNEAENFGAHDLELGVPREEVEASDAMRTQLADLRRLYTSNHDQPGIDEETKQADLRELAQQERILLASTGVARTAFSSPVSRLRDRTSGHRHAI